MAGCVARRIVLDDAKRAELQGRVRRRRIPHGDATPAQIVLLAAEGMNNCEIADEIGVTRRTVGLWRNRFASEPLDGLSDEPRPGTRSRCGRIVARPSSCRPIRSLSRMYAILSGSIRTRRVASP